MPTHEEIIAYLKSSIEQFDDDPADTDFQRGYLSALKETLKVIEEDNVSL